MLSIIRGLPGSGKTFYAHSEGFGNVLVIEADQRFVRPDGEYRFEYGRDDTYTYIEDMLIVAFMHKLKHVIVTTSSGKTEVIQRYVDLAKKYGHKVRVAWLDYLNGSGVNNIHHVPDDVMQKMKEEWELYPGETYLRRVHWNTDDRFINPYHEVKDPPPWFIEIQKKKGVK